MTASAGGFASRAVLPSPNMTIVSCARSGGKGNTLFRYPAPVEPYGHFLARTAVTLANGTAVSAFRAYHACLTAGQLRAAKAARARAEAALCTAETFPQELYQDTWVARRARALLARRPAAQRPRDA